MTLTAFRNWGPSGAGEREVEAYEISEMEILVLTISRGGWCRVENCTGDREGEIGSVNCKQQL